ncbi:uncharacterized protein LOC124613478 [Schistocerca americana]|uniref:uncharacterized protein LOC124613478 n=1 Tax=Schistocerca americana TaxID=7009 RepID=UPI001F4FE2E3|nr:uncharacterized protein LOC124613478 [Schistocerca americana]
MSCDACSVLCADGPARHCATLRLSPASRAPAAAASPLHAAAGPGYLFTVRARSPRLREPHATGARPPRDPPLAAAAAAASAGPHAPPRKACSDSQGQRRPAHASPHW